MEEAAQFVVSTIKQYSNEELLLIEVSFDQYDEILMHCYEFIGKQI